MLPAEDQATLSLAMRVAAPLIDQLTQLAAQQPQIPAVDRFDRLVRQARSLTASAGERSLAE